MSEPTYPHCEHCRVQSPEHNNKYVNHAKPCRIDDCEGAQPIAALPSPSVSAGVDAAVLAEVLDAIGTYDQMMFSDQHRELFERVAATGARAAGEKEGDPAVSEELSEFQRGWQEGAMWQLKRVAELKDRADAGSDFHGAQLDKLLDNSEEDPGV